MVETGWWFGGDSVVMWLIQYCGVVEKVLGCGGNIVMVSCYGGSFVV